MTHNLIRIDNKYYPYMFCTICGLTCDKFNYSLTIYSNSLVNTALFGSLNLYCFDVNCKQYIDCVQQKSKILKEHDILFDKESMHYFCKKCNTEFTYYQGRWMVWGYMAKSVIYCAQNNSCDAMIMKKALE